MLPASQARRNDELFITVSTAGLAMRGKALADMLHLPFVNTVDASNLCDNPLLLRLTEDRIEIGDRDETFNPIYVDFITGALRHRRLYGGGKNQMIVKAVGLKPHYRPTVLDLTAGWGQDAFVLACSGCQVTMLERSPIIAVLLEDGLARARQAEWFLELALQFIPADARDYIQAQQREGAARPDVIYIDPMFPSEKKTALAKKEMRVLRELIGDDGDAEVLIAQALSYAGKRVVVKRPRHGAALSGLKPHMTYTGKSNRFDIYFSAFS